ncbi:MAG: biotin/lipoyl-containing protein, partial [Terrimesophilobacter sp.]
LSQDDIELTGHAIEARVYAEDPEHGFLPSTGRILALREPSGPGIRVDSALTGGLVVSPDYDPMLAKIIAWGDSREVALERLDAALASTVVLGVRTNIEYLRALLADPDVRAGRLDTTLIERRLPKLAFRHPDAGMLAAAARCLDNERAAEGSAAPVGPWRSARGWRIGGVPAAIRYRFASSTEARDDVYSTVDSVTIRGDKVESAGVWACAHDRETLWMGQDGFSWPLKIVDRDAEIRELRQAMEQVDHPQSPEVRSPMPGTVVAVAVTDGDVIEAGATIVTVEAMKMEHKLTASVAGRVSIAVHPGDAVKLDQVLARIEQSSQESAP